MSDGVTHAWLRLCLKWIKHQREARSPVTGNIGAGESRAFKAIDRPKLTCVLVTGIENVSDGLGIDETRDHFDVD
jgi:hypothetical protein